MILTKVLIIYLNDQLISFVCFVEVSFNCHVEKYYLSYKALATTIKNMDAYNLHIHTSLLMNWLWPSEAIWIQIIWVNIDSCNALWHQAIIWSYDLSLVSSSDNQLRKILREIPQPSITKISLENFLPQILFESLGGWWVMTQVNSTKSTKYFITLYQSSENCHHGQNVNPNPTSKQT